MSEPPKTPPLRRNRDFQLLWAGEAVSVLGSRVSAIAYPLLVLALTDSPAKAGIVVFAGTIPYVLAPLPAGALVDRLSRRRLLIAADVGRAAALATVVATLALGEPPFAQLVAVAFVEGTLFILSTTAQTAVVPRVVPPEQLPAALSQNEARERGAYLAGQPLGGVLFDVARAVPFVVDALTYVVSLVTVLLIRADLDGERQPAEGRVRGEVLEGIAWLWRQRFLRAAALLVAASNALFAALVLVLIVRTQDAGASASAIGVMVGLGGLGGLLGSLAAPPFQRRFAGRTIVVGANWVWALLLPLMLLTGNPYALGAVFAAMVFVGPLWNVVLGAYTYALVPARLLGRVTSADTLLAYGAIPLGSLGVGFLLELLGGDGALAVLSSAMLVVALAASVTPAIRRAPRTVEEARAG
ncbi:MAG TPA: MFS transporter [Gaiellaceae bacterium]|nr:MFS transporter [Gaiellaceae bacterium]